MGYLGDPREEAIRPESGITLENDNRVEQMWHWGAAVLDLCDLPVEEYMKPMTVIVSGGTEPGPTPPGPTPTGDTYTVSFMYNGEVVATETVDKGGKVSTSIVTTATEAVNSQLDIWETCTGWNPDPSNTTINKNQNFEPITESNDNDAIYVGFVRTGDTGSVDFEADVQINDNLMSNANDEDGVDLTMGLDYSEDYSNMAEKLDDGEITQEEWDEWKASYISQSAYLPTIYYSKNIDLSKYNYQIVTKQEGGGDITNDFVIKQNVIEYKGVEYNALQYNKKNDQYIRTEDSIDSNYYIFTFKITKKS